MTAVATKYTTQDGLRVYDLDPQASELWTVAGPDGFDPSTIVPGDLPEGFRWITGEEWEGIVNATRKEIVEAVEAADLYCPVDVVDACLRVAESGGDWREELKQAVINDAAEAWRLCS